MKKYKQHSHLVWKCNYHIIWCPKYRFSILTGLVKKWLVTIRMYYKRNECEVEELNLQPNQIHIKQSKINKNSFFLLSTVILLTSCLHNNISTDGLPVIDINKQYPEKEMILSDIADIKYVYLESKRNDFLYRGAIKYVTENTIVVNDIASGSILFFSKDGTPKSRFNRYGNGPEEYNEKVIPIVYDEVTDEVFVSVSFVNYIQVYSSKGEYKRKLLLPHGVRLTQMDSYDNQSLIVFDEGRMLYKAQPKTSEDNMDYLTHLVDSSFFLISKADGQVLNYIQMLASKNDLSFKTPAGNPMMIYNTNIVKNAEGFLLCNPEIDTVFLYGKTKNLTPIICKTPLIGKSEPKIILNNCMDVGKYQFMEIRTVGYDYFGDRNRNKYYVRDKNSGKVFQQKIVIPDYRDKKITIYPNYSNFFHENGTHIELDLIELKGAYRENKLSGKLKELVGTLNENEGNNVFMFVNFN